MVSVNNEAKTVKLVTQWNISLISYDDDSSAFEGSYMESWLNDTSVDGFLGNLRDYENFIVTDARWNATLDATDLGNITRPSDDGTIVTDAVGLLNTYEYQSSYHGTTYSNGYLNNGLYWWTLTPSSASYVRIVNSNSVINDSYPTIVRGVRPSINLKSNVKIVDGNGTETNPYRLAGDNDSNLRGTLLNTRYSGEYIRFGNDENNLYQIVSHETEGLTKITSAEPLKNSGEFIISAFDSNSSVNYSSTNTIGTFLNGEYLTSYVDSAYSNMIEENTTWYLGTVGSGASYKLAKYIDTSMSGYATSAESKVGLLRLGELMSGQFERYMLKGGNFSTGLTTTYWTLTSRTSLDIWCVYRDSNIVDLLPTATIPSVRPSMNLKSNVLITGGDGTKENPFEIELK